MNHLHRNGGRFITVLPKTRKEDKTFRQRLCGGEIAWRHLFDKTDDQGEVIDRLSVCDEPSPSKEGFRILWFHSTRKAELDAAARANHIDRALDRLRELREKLSSPRTRIRTKEKATEAAKEILRECGATELIALKVGERVIEDYRQEKRGRPGKDTRYVKKERSYCSLDYDIDEQAIARQKAGDGAFPLITNVESLSEVEVLEAYKNQPLVEKRFSQLKTDFRVAPVYLKSVRRIAALLCLYFFVLMAEALLERELRKAMDRADVESLPIYPERRACRRPTTRKLIDLFEGVARHTLQVRGRKPTTLVTDLSRAQRKVLKLLRLSATEYGC